MLDLNMTLLGQFLTFILLVWFSMKYIWPQMIKAIEERQTRIAEGLLAGEKGIKALAMAEHRSREVIQEARLQAKTILEQAQAQGQILIEQAKTQAHEDYQKRLSKTHADIQQEFSKAKEALVQDMSRLVALNTEKMLQSHLTKETQASFIKALLALSS